MDWSVLLNPTESTLAIAAMPTIKTMCTHGTNGSIDLTSLTLLSESRYNASDDDNSMHVFAYGMHFRLKHAA